MSKKEEFIKYIEEIINVDEMSDGAKIYWEALKSANTKEKSKFTDNGKLILNYLKEHDDEIPRKAKDIAEELGLSPRSISGSMRSLVSGGYVESLGDSPKAYVISNEGRNINTEE